MGKLFKKKKNNRPAKTISLQALEQRLLLDGAAVTTLADGLSIESIESDVDSAVQALAINSQPNEHKDSFIVPDLADNASVANPAEIVFIDGAVVNQQNSDVQDLLDSINPSTPVHYIDLSSDGMAQISAVLAQYDELDAVHIISHGEQGQLDLGNGVLNSHTMQTDYVDELALIGNALSEHGDILLYGCNFSEGEQGRAATALLAQLTGADIAASIDVTGAADKGGDWTLESASGLVLTKALSADSFTGTLALSAATLNIVSDGTPTWDGDNLPGNDADGANGIIRSHDVISMEVFYNTDAAGATDLNFTSTLPDGLVWNALPAAAALDPDR